MKEFMLFIRNEVDHNSAWPEEKLQEFFKACEQYIWKLKKEGKLKSAQPLIREGSILSGSKGAWKTVPFRENKEVIVGYYHINAKDIEEATEIAKLNPEFDYGKTARIEVRPIKTKEAATGFEYPGE
jgi:hypothetical protein